MTSDLSREAPEIAQNSIQGLSSQVQSNLCHYRSFPLLPQAVALLTFDSASVYFKATLTLVLLEL